MPDLMFKTAWRLGELELAAEALAFWDRLDLVPPTERERRAQELCVLAYSSGELAGVATAQLAPLSGLRARFAFYGISVDPRFRQQLVGVRLTVEAKRVIGDWSEQNPQEQVMGLAAVIQSAELREYQRRPLWEEEGLGLNLVGYGPRGEQIRVAWFRHVRV